MPETSVLQASDREACLAMLIQNYVEGRGLDGGSLFPRGRQKRLGSAHTNFWSWQVHTPGAYPLMAPV